MTIDDGPLDLAVSTDYLAGPDRRPLTTSVIRFPRRIMSLHELVRTKVMQEIHLFNERKSAAYGAEYLDPAEWEFTIREGERFMGDPLKKGKVNPTTEVRLALRALIEGRFKVVLNGRDLREGETDIRIDEESAVVFVRLVPFE